jgi:hypothetical protein
MAVHMNRDKERILKIISDVIDASRLLADENRRLTRNRLLSLMNERRPQYAQLSRDEFQNHFTTRVDRKSIVPVEDLVCLIEVILEQYADCITADAVLELCDAARLPLREYRRISRYFSITEWNRAWRMYDAATVSNYQDDLVFSSREGIINQIYQQFTHQPIVILSGSSGIGKTRLGLRICTMIEVDQQRVCVLNGRDIHDIESFVEHLAVVLRVRPFGKESVLQRLQYYLQDNQVFVFVDDLSVYHVDTIIALLNHVVQLLPSLHILVTTTMPMPRDNIHRLINVVILHGLDFNESQLLFRQSCYQLGFFATDIPLMTRQLSQCEGNPMAIKMLAYIASQNYEHIELHQHMSRMMESLSDTESKVIRFLVVFDAFISIELVATVCGVDEAVLSMSIHSLVQKGIVTLHNYNMVMCHVTVRVWYQSKQLFGNMRDIQIDSINTLSQLQMHDSIVHHKLLGFQRSDMTQILRMVNRLIVTVDDDSIITSVIKLLVNWRWYWWQMGYESDVLSICTKLSGTSHQTVQQSGFMLLYATLNWRCGNIEIARNMLTTVEVNSTMSGDLMMVALAKLEMALTYAAVYNQIIFTTYIRQAQQLFARLQMRDWQHYSLIQQALFLIHEGQFDKGLEYCQLVEAEIVDQHGYLQSLIVATRVVGAFLQGHYEAARKYGEIARQICMQLNMDAELHITNIYAWAIDHMLQPDLRESSYLRVTSFVSQLTQVAHVLLLADFIVFMLFEDDYIENALVLYRVVSHARDNLSVPRMKYMDSLLEQKRRASLILYRSIDSNDIPTEVLSISEIIAYVKRSVSQFQMNAPRLQ